MASLHNPWPALQDHLTQFIYKESKFALPCIWGDWVWARVSTPLLMHCYLLGCSKWPMRFKRRSKRDQILPLQFWQQHLFARSVLSMWSQNHYYSSLLKHEETSIPLPSKPPWTQGRIQMWLRYLVRVNWFSFSSAHSQWKRTNQFLKNHIRGKTSEERVLQ